MWSAVHRKWRRHGWDTLSVRTVGIKSAMVRSLRERAKGIRERGGDSLGGEDVRATVSPKEERRKGKGGSSTGMRAWGSSADQMPRKRETHSTRGWLVWHDAVATQEWGANGSNTDSVCRARSEIT